MFSTFGIRGFTGGAGEDTLLAQMVGSVNIIMLVFGALAIVLAVRPSRGPVLALGIVLVIVGVLLFLFTLFPFGLLDILLGVAVLVLRKHA